MGVKMTIPQPPKKQEIKFNDPDFHQQKRKFNQQIREMIFKFYRIIPRSQNRDVLLKFADCINPGKSLDVTKLPYVGKKHNAKTQNKIECLFALISWIIQQYWIWCENNVKVSAIEGDLRFLNQIYKSGLDQYQIQGDLVKGYYLEKK